MRSKIDARLERVRGRGKKPRSMPGGKALQRLFYFLGRRNPKLNDDVVADLAVPKAARPKFGLTRKARLAKVPGPRGRARPRRGRGASPEAKKHAAAIIKAANALARKTPRARKPRGRAAARVMLASGGSWQFLGPTRIPNGQTYGTNRVDVIGRVACIAVDPNNAAHILLGAAGGGIWESTNTGATWAPRSDFMPSLAIGAIAFDPSAPSRVYAGSGEGNFYANLGAGVYKSTNGGTTWSVIATAPFVGVGFYDLVVDPQVPSTLYAATTNGFYVSLNSGATWTQKRNVRCWDISVCMIIPPIKINGNILELLVAFQDGLFVSTNSGNTFTVIALPTSPGTNWNRLAVDHVKAAPSLTPAVAYAFGAQAGAAHLWRRSGTTWTKITTLPAINVNQAWYDWYVAATPNNANEVYLGEIAGYRGNLSGSWTWTPTVTNGSNSIHPDQHCLTFSPTNSSTIYVGNDGGIFRSTNKGTTWTALNDGLGITELEYLAGNPNTWKWLIAGTQDNGTARFTGASVWDHIADGDGGDCGVNQTSPNIAYHSYFNATLERSTTFGNFGSWTTMVPPPSVASLFYPPVEVSDLTVAIGANSLIYSLNGTTPFSTVALSGGTPSAMRARNPTSILVGTTSGAMLRVTFTGGTPSVATLTSPRAAYISCIAVDPSNPNRYWVTFSQTGGGLVYRSDDGGVTWVNCTTAGLPNIPMNAVAIDPANYKRIFVAADVGVYETTNLGASWAIYGSGLPNAIAADLLLHAQDRMLTCGMRNRGAWAIPI
jgi:hypothetical protein